MAGVELISVENDEQGMRLDRWFKVHYPGLGFGHLQKLLRSGQIRVDGGRAKSDTRLEPGQSVRVPPLGVDRKGDAPLTAGTIRHQGDADVLAKMLLYEDPKVFVFNKPAGLAVQGGSGVARHVDDMLEAWRNKKGEKPRLVHRLDRDTSGCLVVAKRRSVLRSLHALLREGAVEKKYLALVAGRWTLGRKTIEAPLATNRRQGGERVVRVEAEGKESASTFRPVAHYGKIATLVEVEIHTGRTHQIRVHAAFAGHPVAGDEKYGDAEFNRRMKEFGLKRLFLHSQSLAFDWPDSGEHFAVNAPLPPELAQVVEALEGAGA